MKNKGGRGQRALTCTQVSSIIKEFLVDNLTMSYIAKKYNVGRTTIYNIIYGLGYQECREAINKEKAKLIAHNNKKRRWLNDKK